MNKQTIEATAKKIALSLFERFPEYEKLLTIKFEACNRMTRCAGRAYHRKSLVKLSIPFFSNENNFKEHFYNTVTHEIAHLLAPSLPEYGRRKPHGSEWQAMHRKLGGNAKRCHQMQLSDAYDIRFTTPCARCGEKIVLSQRQWANVRNGTTEYLHKSCYEIPTYLLPFRR